MSKKSATVLVVFIVAIVAFCLANVFGSMMGTYHLNLFDEDNSTDILNNTTDDNPIKIESNSGSSNYDSNYVKSEDVYVSDSSSSGQSSDHSHSSSGGSSESGGSESGGGETPVESSE